MKLGCGCLVYFGMLADRLHLATIGGNLPSQQHHQKQQQQQQGKAQPGSPLESVANISQEGLRTIDEIMAAMGSMCVTGEGDVKPPNSADSYLLCPHGPFCQFK